jgi:hypothetical protein
VPPELHDALLWENETELVEKLALLLTGELPGREALRESARQFAWANVIRPWDRVLSALVRGDFATKPSIPDA